MAINEGARKNDSFKVVCITPDVCLTPMGSSMPPVPYQIVGILDQSKTYSSNVNFAGCPAMTMKGFVAEVKGDEAGTGGGVMSGVNKKHCIPITFSPTVRANKNYVLFQKDTLMWMNGPAPQGTGNTIGKLVYEGSTPQASDVSEGKSSFVADPPVSPETLAEESFLDKLGSMADKLTSDQGITGLVNMAPQLATMDWSNPGSVLGTVGGIAGLGGLGTIAQGAGMAAKAVGVAQAGLSLANFSPSNPGSYMGAASTLAGAIQFAG